LFANFHTAFAAQTFLFFDHHGLFILEFVDFHRANLNTFTASYAFFSVHFRFITHRVSFLSTFSEIPHPSPAASFAEAHPFATPQPSHAKTPVTKDPENVDQIITRILLIVYRPIEGSMAGEVVLPPFVFLPKNLICLVKLFQTIFTPRIALVPVRVILQREAAIGLFDLFTRSLTGKSHNLVVVLHDDKTSKKSAPMA